MQVNKKLLFFLFLASPMLIIQAKRRSERFPSAKAALSCPIKEESISYQCGKFVMNPPVVSSMRGFSGAESSEPYPQGFKNVVPTSQFDVLDCYVIFSNKTNCALKVTFYHVKDRIGSGQDIVAMPEGKAGSAKLDTGMISGFALPIIKWCDKQGTGGVSPRGARIIEVLKHAPIIGFSISKLKDPAPKKPMIELPKDRTNFPTYFYDIVALFNKTGFEVKQSTGLANK